MANQPFQDFIADCLTEIDNKNDRAEPALKRATVHQLRELSTVRTSFMEGSFSFSTIVDTDAYDAANAAGWPPDLLEIYQLYGTAGSERYGVEGPYAIGELRLLAGQWSKSPRPQVWAYHNEQLHLAPTPSAVATLAFDYWKDASLDETTGTEITVSSTIETNGWFGRGVNALRCAVLWEYHLSVSKDYDQATVYEAQLVRARETLEREYHARQYKGGQSHWIFGPGERMPWPERVLPE